VKEVVAGVNKAEWMFSNRFCNWLIPGADTICGSSGRLSKDDYEPP